MTSAKNRWIREREDALVRAERRAAKVLAALYRRNPEAVSDHGLKMEAIEVLAAEDRLREAREL